MTHVCVIKYKFTYKIELHNKRKLFVLHTIYINIICVLSSVLWFVKNKSKLSFGCDEIRSKPFVKRHKRTDCFVFARMTSADQIFRTIKVRLTFVYGFINVLFIPKSYIHTLLQP